MFPLRDENPTERFPFVTIAILVGCVAVWGVVQGWGVDERALVGSVCDYGMIPAEITGSPHPPSVSLGPGATCRLGGASSATLLTSIFLHGSWFHLIGNLWFLWIFGNNVEDSMGRMRFLLFYLLTGLTASAAQIAVDPGGTVPTVGASGAISGVMGAYLVLFPRTRILTAIVLIFFVRVVALPAWLLLGYWFAIQLFASAADPGGAQSGVAFAAHLGGFVAGAALVKLFERPGPVRRRRVRFR